MPVPHHSAFTGQMPFLPPNQQRQSTDDTTEEDLLQTKNLDTFANDEEKMMVINACHFATTVMLL